MDFKTGHFQVNQETREKGEGKIERSESKVVEDNL
jgi:hypothetical protein